MLPNLTTFIWLFNTCAGFCMHLKSADRFICFKEVASFMSLWAVVEWIRLMRCGNIEDAYLQCGYLDCMIMGLVKCGKGHTTLCIVLRKVVWWGGTKLCHSHGAFHAVQCGDGAMVAEVMVIMNNLYRTCSSIHVFVGSRNFFRIYSFKKKFKILLQTATETTSVFFFDKNIGIFFFSSVNWTNNYFLEIFTKYFFSKKIRRKPLETTWVNFDLEAPTHLRHGLPQPKFGCSSNLALKNPTQKIPVCWTTCWKLTKTRLTGTHIRSELEYLLKH
jgi:hypothetical protein